MKQWIEDVGSYISSFFRNKIVLISLVFAGLLAIIIVRLFDLQIINGSSYVSNLSTSVEKQMTTQASRGRIFDRNGVLLAYNDLAYSIVISDSGYYKTNDEKNAKINNCIDKTLNIIEEYGDTYSQDFSVSYSEDTGFSYKLSGNSLKGFLRDSYGVAKISDLSEEQANASADKLISDLCDRYKIDRNSIKPEHLLEMLYLRVNMTANSYNRYVTFTIANEVNDRTIAAIQEDSDELVGVSVEQRTVRRYNDAKYFSSIIGYTGAISSEQLETFQ